MDDARKTERDARVGRALAHLADLELTYGPWQGDYPTFAAWQCVRADYAHERAMALHRFHRLEREAAEPAPPPLPRPVPLVLTAARPANPGPLGDDDIRSIPRTRPHVRSHRHDHLL